MTIEPHVALMILCCAIALFMVLRRFRKPLAFAESGWLRQRRRRGAIVRLTICTGMALLANVLVSWAITVHPTFRREVTTHYVRLRASNPDVGEDVVRVDRIASVGSTVLSMAVWPSRSTNPNVHTEGLNHWLVWRTLEAANEEPAQGRLGNYFASSAWAVGWPYACWFSTYTSPPSANGVLVRSGELQLPTWVRSVFFAKPRNDPFIVPYFVHWPSFLSNVILFALPPYIVWSFLASRRLRKRFERGQCLRCAYDALGLAKGAPCPECGLASQTHENPVSSPA
jgi:hypothetical protein